MTQSAVNRIRRAFAFHSHRTESFKLSIGPVYIEKVRAIVGLYLAPPKQAAVLCVDQKSQIQPLNCTQPPFLFARGRRNTVPTSTNATEPRACLLPLTPPPARSWGSAKADAGTWSSAGSSTVIDVNVPRDIDVRLVLDKYGTHKTAIIRRRLVKRARFHLYFTPTGVSWLNLVERRFGLLTGKQIRRGNHRGTRQLEDAIRRYLGICNENPKPFVWTKTADEILLNLKIFCRSTYNSGY